MPFPLRAVTPLLGITVLLLPVRASGGDQRRDEALTPNDHEERTIERAVERAVKAGDTEGHRWQRELSKAYPGQIGPGLTEADMEKWFGVLAGDGRDWRRDAAPNRQVADLFDRAARRLELGPVPSIRRGEFLDYARHQLAARPQKHQKAGDTSGDADRVFRVLDRDGSGVLEAGEWTDHLRVNIRGADKDGNRRVDANEYRMYYAGRVTEAVEAATKAAAAKPGAAAGGKLPTWFTALDTDGDGQIGLYEWRAGNRPVAEFTAMDLDGDGVLPPAEYLRFVRLSEAEGRGVEAEKAPAEVPTDRRAGRMDKRK